MSLSILSQLVGHKKNISNLLSLKYRLRLPHAMLFVGPEGQGKKLVALGLAQELMCEVVSHKPAEGQIAACGLCSNCLTVAKLQSPGIFVLAPEKGVIKIDAARAVIRQLTLMTWGANRVVIIDDAHLLNPQAANALLKSIEEPPERTFFILVAPSSENIMKTIRSRSQVFRFGMLTDKERSTLTPKESTSDMAEDLQPILQLIWQGQWSQAISLSRETIDSRDKALQFSKEWLRQVRYDWTQTDGIEKETLSDWAQVISELERDLLGHCDVQLTIENSILSLEPRA